MLSLIYLQKSYSISHMSVFILISLGRFSNVGIFPTAFSKHSCRKWHKILQSKRKWYSSSTFPGQNWQKRSSFGVLGVVCLPVSMAKRWFESLNLATWERILKFLTFTKYFSIPISVLKVAYVLSLLESSRIHPSDVWWKLSLSLSKTFLCTNG